MKWTLASKEQSLGRFQRGRETSEIPPLIVAPIQPGIPDANGNVFELQGVQGMQGVHIIHANKDDSELLKMAMRARKISMGVEMPLLCLPVERRRRFTDMPEVVGMLDAFANSPFSPLCSESADLPDGNGGYTRKWCSLKPGHPGPHQTEDGVSFY